MKTVKGLVNTNKFAAEVCLVIVALMIGLSMFDLPHWFKREPQAMEQCK